MNVKAIGALTPNTPLGALNITRRSLGSQDVSIEILYCGVCHSDIHQARSEWEGTHYPCVPGHEIVGRVTAVGGDVSSFYKGDLVGIGCIVDSCKQCGECEAGQENYCDDMTGTYNFPTMDSPGYTLGGYSQHIVVHERYVLSIRHDPSQLAAVAPLLCAGITTYSPLKHWNIGPGKKVGIVGIGGLGHMGIKLAHAMGADVVAFTTSESKSHAAYGLGADSVVLSHDQQHMAAHRNSFDLIINTVAAPHFLDDYITLLKRDGTLTLVGAPSSPHPANQVMNLISKRRSITGSMIGGIPETQEMLDFCAQHNIVSEIELIDPEEINNAYERMLIGDIKYRFVMDMSKI